MISAIIQARVGSTRLPNKVFADLCGKPILWHIINRAKSSKLIDRIIIATTSGPGDDRIASWAEKNGIEIYRGSENDVLSRYFEASRHFLSDIIVRITADDPFKDPAITDQVIQLLLRENLDFAYNNKPPSFPEGLDTEVFSFKALERAQMESKDAFEREHVTQYFYRNPVKFRQKNLLYKEDISNLRLTIDTAEDYEMARKVYEGLYKENEIFSLQDILRFFRENPEIPFLNSKVKRSAMYTKNNTDETVI